MRAIQISEDSIFNEKPIKLRREGHCNMCGMCCKAIRLNSTYKDIKETVEQFYPKIFNKIASEEEMEETFKDTDRTFIYLYWKEISKEEVYKINPYVRTWFESEWAKKDENEGSWWTCTKLDSKTNKCTIQDNKPHVCSDHPYYGGNLDKTSAFYSENCGYKVDLPKDDE